MFEGWLADVLATYLGRFIDVQRERLRISLWAGQCVLENVQLRTEALDYLQLPIAIGAGSVGRLCLKIPWGRWTMTGQPLVIELTDVTLYLTAREDHEWEEGPAVQRDHAAKQAGLAAAELAKLSERMASQRHKSSMGGSSVLPSSGGGSGGGSSSSAIWGLRYLMELLTSFLLNRLQLSINNLHVYFKAPGTGGTCSVLGLQVDSVSTTSELRSLPAQLANLFSQSAQRLSGARITRHLLVRQWNMYWQCAGEAGPRQAHPGKTDFILCPMDCAVRLALGASTPTAAAATGHTDLDVMVGTQLLRLQINPEQLRGMLKLYDDFEVWTRRNRYGRFRPPGWRTALELRQRRGQQQWVLQRHSSSESGTGLGWGRSSGGVETDVDDDSDADDDTDANTDADTDADAGSGSEVSSQRRGGASGGSVGEGEGVDPTTSGSLNSPRGTGRALAPVGSSSPGTASSITPAAPLTSSTQLTGAIHSTPLPASRNSSSVSALAGAGPVPTEPARSTAGPSSIDGLARGSSPLRRGLRDVSCSGSGQSPEGGTNWRKVWQYAVRSVLYDLRMRRCATNAPRRMREFCKLRRQYVALYRSRLEAFRAASQLSKGQGQRSASHASHDSLVDLDMDDSAARLHRLEADLNVHQVMLLRSIAEASMEQQEQQQQQQQAAVAAAGGAAGPQGASGGRMTSGSPHINLSAASLLSPRLKRTPSVPIQPLTTLGEPGPGQGPAALPPVPASPSAAGRRSGDDVTPLAGSNTGSSSSLAPPSPTRTPPQPAGRRATAPSAPTPARHGVVTSASASALSAPEAPVTPSLSTHTSTTTSPAASSTAISDLASAPAPSAAKPPASTHIHHTAWHPPQASATAHPPGPPSASSSAAPPSHYSWLAWGIHGVYGYFAGTSSSGGASGAAAIPRPPTDSDVKHLYNLLQQPEHAAHGSNSGPGSLVSEPGATAAPSEVGSSSTEPAGEGTPTESSAGHATAGAAGCEDEGLSSASASAQGATSAGDRKATPGLAPAPAPAPTPGHPAPPPPPLPPPKRAAPGAARAVRTANLASRTSAKGGSNPGTPGAAAPAPSGAVASAPDLVMARISVHILEATLSLQDRPSSPSPPMPPHPVPSSQPTAPPDPGTVRHGSLTISTQGRVATQRTAPLLACFGRDRSRSSEWDPSTMRPLHRGGETRDDEEGGQAHRRRWRLGGRQGLRGARVSADLLPLHGPVRPAAASGAASVSGTEGTGTGRRRPVSAGGAAAGGTALAPVSEAEPPRELVRVRLLRTAAQLTASGSGAAQVNLEVEDVEVLDCCSGQPNTAADPPAARGGSAAPTPGSAGQQREAAGEASGARGRGQLVGDAGADGRWPPSGHAEAGAPGGPVLLLSRAPQPQAAELRAHAPARRPQGLSAVFARGAAAAGRRDTPRALGPSHIEAWGLPGALGAPLPSTGAGGAGLQALLPRPEPVDLSWHAGPSSDGTPTHSTSTGWIGWASAASASSSRGPLDPSTAASPALGADGLQARPPVLRVSLLIPAAPADNPWGKFASPADAGTPLPPHPPPHGASPLPPPPLPSAALPRPSPGSARRSSQGGCVAGMPHAPGGGVQRSVR